MAESTTTNPDLFVVPDEEIIDATPNAPAAMARTAPQVPVAMTNGIPGLNSALAPLLAEAAIATLSGSAVGAMAAPKTRRGKGGAIGALGAFGVYALVRGVLRPNMAGGGGLSQQGRMVAGVLGLAAAGGSVYLGMFRK